MELRENGTQAVISSILPGEEVVLTASAKIPPDFTEEELINTVLVFPEGEEEKGKSDQAVVVVEKQPKPSVSMNKRLNAPRTTPAVSPAHTPASGQNRTSYVVTASPGTVYSAAGTQTDGKGSTYAASPKTGDESPLLLLAVLAGGAGAVIIIILCCHLRRKKS